MVITTQEHKKRKAECLEIVETVTALCLLELLGIADFDEDELTYVVGLGMHALGTMSQVPRNLTPINPFHSKDDLQFEFAFRFTKQEVHRLLPCLHITPVVTVQKVGLVDGYIFLLVLLHRLHNPVTYIDMEETFGLLWYTIARIYGEAVDHVYELFIFRLLFDVVLLQMYAPKYADAITRKSGGAVTRCIGFLDGTIRQQCRPVRGQRAIFSGHKRYHGLKFQALTVPDGLIAAMFGPVEGRLHDSTMLGLSNLMFMIRTFLPDRLAHLRGWCLPTPSRTSETVHWTEHYTCTGSLEHSNVRCAHIGGVGFLSCIKNMGLCQLHPSPASSEIPISQILYCCSYPNKPS